MSNADKLSESVRAIESECVGQKIKAIKACFDPFDDQFILIDFENGKSIRIHGWVSWQDQTISVNLYSFDNSIGDST
jgi:hypothetical protein